MVREIYLQVQWYFCLSVPSLNKVVWLKHLLLEVDFSRCGPYLSERVRELRVEKEGLLEKQAALEQETQELNKQLAKLRVQAATTGEAASGEPATRR